MGEPANYPSTIRPRAARRPIVVLLVAVVAGARAADLSPFSAAASLAPWTAVYLPSVARHTRFTLVEDDGQRVLRIDTQASAGSLMHVVPATVRAAGVLGWRWKLPAHNSRSDPRSKKGDDYPARIYVLFDYDTRKLGLIDRARLRIARSLYGEHVPAAALCYVWDPRLPRETTLWNAFTERVRMVVVRGGDADLGRWVAETRDLKRDFKLAFNEEAPPIMAIAVAGDGDNSGASGVAFVGDISLTP